MRAWRLGSMVALVLATAAPAPSAPPLRPRAASAVVVYAAPLAGHGRVVRGFTAPATPYGPGHRGVDLAAAPGTRVLAAADGTVTFAGPVAGRGVVVLAHPDGVTTEYEPVRALVVRGDRVRRGQAIARIVGRHPGCPLSCLHWGARRDAVYLDPLSLLRPLGPVVLLPWPGDG